MSTPPERPVINSRISETLCTLNEFRQTTDLNPRDAMARAFLLEDPSIRASVLIAMARQIGRPETLVDALETLLGSKREIPQATLSAKIAKVAFTAVELGDNILAVETADEVSGPGIQRQTKQQLSIAMTDSIRRMLEGNDTDELSRYPDFVVASFQESSGDTTYFGTDMSNFYYVHAPKYLHSLAKEKPLDPIFHGGLALPVLRDSGLHFSQMLNLITKHGPSGINPPPEQPII